MNNFSFVSPTQIIFGKDKEKEVGFWIKHYNGKKVLIHYGSQRIKENGLLLTIKNSLTQEGIDFIELGGVVPNPRLDLVYTGIELARRNNIDFILAVGGGSVIDSAKAIAFGLKYNGDVWDFFSSDEHGNALKIETESCIPIASILTIAAAGSEASNSCVITNFENQMKRACDNDFHRPIFAIENPYLTVNLSQFQTACSIVDIMSHSFERYFCKKESGNTLTDRLCESIFMTCMECGRTLKNNPCDIDARSNIMLASTLSHNGLTGIGRFKGGDWSSHLIEHELSGEFDVTHGAGLAVIIPAWMKYVYKQNIPQFFTWATKIMGLPPENNNQEMIIEEAINRLECFFHFLGLPTTLDDLLGENSVTNETLIKMAKRIRVTNTNGTIGSLLELNANDIINIFQLALR